MIEPLGLADAVRAVIDNYLVTMDLLRRYSAGERSPHRRFGRVQAIPLAHEVPFYNAVLALDPAGSIDDVIAALEWVESLGLDPTVHLIGGSDPAIPIALTARGFRPGDGSPAMALRPIPPTLATPIPPGATIRVGGAELANDWFAAVEGGERFQRTFSSALIGDPSVRIAVADLDGEPVAGAMAVRSDPGVVGVYAVATAERARRRGLGRAATWAVIRAGAEAWGSRVAVLEASEMGVPLYAAMGFTVVGEVTIFSRTVADQASPAATR